MGMLLSLFPHPDYRSLAARSLRGAVYLFLILCQRCGSFISARTMATIKIAAPITIIIAALNKNRSIAPFLLRARVQLLCNWCGQQINQTFLGCDARGCCD